MPAGLEAPLVRAEGRQGRQVHTAGRRARGADGHAAARKDRGLRLELHLQFRAG